MHKILVIYAADRDAANTFCNNIGADGETFSIQLFNASDDLAGYWCGWNMTDEQLEAVEANKMFQVFDTTSEALTTTGWHVATNEV